MPDDIEGRNIMDHFANMSVEEIRADLDAKRHPFSTLAVNIEYDINIATIVRNNNAFLGTDFFTFGRRRFNRRGCCGTYIYEHMKHVENLETFPWENYAVIGVDNTPGAVSIHEHQWDFNRHTLLCFGQEKEGLLPEIIARCAKVVYIPQYGSVRSINVGCASAVAMDNFVRSYNAK